MGKRMMLENGGSIRVDRHGTDAVIKIRDMEEDVVTVARTTPAEWDAFVAAGNAALGRHATPLEARLLDAIEAADEHAHKGWSLGVEAEDLAAAKGKAEGLRAALVMAREAGPTVPRGAVAAVLDRLARVAAVLESDDRFAQREARQVLWKVLDDMKAMLDTSAATTTAKESCHADD